jgi:16S rRNA (guanine527-N7)-methyltransferase
VSDTAARLRDRARGFDIAVPPEVEAPLVTYFDLLFHWNAKINLTGLTDRDAAIDRLLLEPLAAALSLPHNVDMVDLGSGGGSPAIPLALALGACRLVMIESKARKAAFLREAARAIGLHAIVESERFEVVADRGQYKGKMALVSVRAVRVHQETLRAAESFLEPTGRLALFTGLPTLPLDCQSERLRHVRATPLLAGSYLVLLQA